MLLLLFLELFSVHVVYAGECRNTCIVKLFLVLLLPSKDICRANSLHGLRAAGAGAGHTFTPL